MQVQARFTFPSEGEWHGRSRLPPVEVKRRQHLAINAVYIVLKLITLHVTASILSIEQETHHSLYRHLNTLISK